MSATEWIEPTEINLARRFDILAKFKYAQASASGSLTDYHRQAYEEHIRVFNAFFETRAGEAEPKVSAEDFVSDFDGLLRSMDESGFDDSAAIRLAPGNHPHDGAHRIAAALALDSRVAVNRVAEQFVANWDFRFFRDRGMDPCAMDFAATAALELIPNLRLAVVFGSALKQADAIFDELDALDGNGTTYYERRIELSRLGCDNLIRVLYEGEPWLGRREFGLLGAGGKSRPCFPEGSPRAIRVKWFRPSVDEDELIEAKTRVRSIANLGKHSIHISNNLAETQAISDWLLDANGRHLLNHKSFRHFAAFERDFTRLAAELAANKRAASVCVVGSSVMSVYGIRDARDLDVIDAGEPVTASTNSNAHWHSHGFDIRELVFSPENHFHYRGIKCLALRRVAELKTKRGEAKDKIDLALIDSLLPQPSGARRRLARAALLIRLYSNAKFLRSYVGHWIARLKHRAARF